MGEPARAADGSRFEIVAPLGEGSGGVVYRAIDRDTGEVVALKTLRRADADTLALLKNEFRVVQDLHHPNLVHVRDLVLERGEWRLSMEYVDGVDLLRYVGGDAASLRPDRPSGAAIAPTFDEARLRAGMRQLAEALVALHRAGRIHRDIKPPNVLVTRAGHVVVLDFGIALEVGALAARDEGIAGSVLYMAPEQISGDPVEAPADWYAVGVILYRALAGRHPFEGSAEAVMEAKLLATEAPDVEAIAPSAPRDLAALCRGLLEPDPSRRPRGEEVLRALGGDVESAPPPASDATCVGRDVEMGALDRAYADVQAGAGVTVLIEGESGVGKSVFARAFAHARLADAAPPTVLFGRCYEREATPFKAFSAVLGELARQLLERPASEIERALPEGAGLLPRMFPELGRVPAIAARSDAASLDPIETRRRTFAALRALVVDLATARPLVIVVDDLQWADADSFELLAELTRPSQHASATARLLVVATMRVAPELRERAARQLAGDVRMLPLRRLTPSSATELVDAVAAQLGCAIDPEIARAVIGEADGHPMFLVELLRERMRAKRAAPTLRLDDAVRARVSRLPDTPRRLLEVVCLAGLPIPQQTAAAAAGLSAGELTEGAALLRADHLVLTTGGRRKDTIEPYHDRIRESVVASLDGDAARALHRRIAETLETTTSPDAEMLAHHWAEAGEAKRASRYAVAAAERATAALAFDRAARLYERALRLDGEDPARARTLRRALAEALTNAGQWSAAATHRLVLAEASQGLEALSLRQVAAEQLLCSGRFDEGVRLLDGLLRGVGFFVPRNPIVIVAAVLIARLVLRVRGLRYVERSADAIPPARLAQLDLLASAGYGLAMTDNVLSSYFMTRGALFALGVGEPHRLARSLAMTAGIDSTAGKPGLAWTQRLIDATRALADRLGTPIAEGTTMQADAWKQYMVGAWTEAKRRLLAAEAIYREKCIGVAFLLGSVRSLLYRTLTYRGDLRELEARLAPTLREADAIGDVHAASNMRTGPLVALRLAADRPDLARGDLAWVAERLPQTRFLLQHYFYVNARAMLLLYEGDARAASDEIEAAWRPLRRSLLLRIPVVRALAFEQRGRCALARAAVDPSEQPALLARAEACARALDAADMGFASAHAALLRAGIARVRGETATALAQVREARRLFAEQDMALLEATARYAEGALLGGEDGARATAAALERFDAEGVTRPERYVAIHAPGLAA